MEDKEKLKKIVLQAASSLWIDKLPLSKEYVKDYYDKRVEELDKAPKLVLKRGDKNGCRV